MLPERAGVRVALGTTRDLTYVGFLQKGIKSPGEYDLDFCYFVLHLFENISY